MKSFMFKDERGRLDVFQEGFDDLVISSFQLIRGFKIIFVDEGDFCIPLGASISIVQRKFKVVNLGDVVSKKSIVMSFGEVLIYKRKEKNADLVQVEDLFKINRIYILSESTLNMIRGAHAHKKLSQVFFVTGERVYLKVVDQFGERVHNLDPDRPFIMEPGKWRELVFKNRRDKVVVLASMKFDESDYIRDYSDFKLYLNNKNQL